MNGLGCLKTEAAVYDFCVIHLIILMEDLLIVFLVDNLMQDLFELHFADISN